MVVSIPQGGAGVKPGGGSGKGLGFFRHDDPEDQVDDGARKGGEDSDEGV